LTGFCFDASPGSERVDPFEKLLALVVSGYAHALELVSEANVCVGPGRILVKMKECPRPPGEGSRSLLDETRERPQVGDEGRELLERPLAGVLYLSQYKTARNTVSGWEEPCRQRNLFDSPIRAAHDPPRRRSWQFVTQSTRSVSSKMRPVPLSLRIAVRQRPLGNEPVDSRPPLLFGVVVRAVRMRQEAEAVGNRPQRQAEGVGRAAGRTSTPSPPTRP